MHALALKNFFCFFQYSICSEPLIELSNPGASGSLFFVTSDDEFIIKTVQHKEAEFLQKLLPGYYMVSNWSYSPLYSLHKTMTRIYVQFYFTLLGIRFHLMTLPIFFIRFTFQICTPTSIRKNGYKSRIHLR